MTQKLKIMSRYIKYTEKMNYKIYDTDIDNEIETVRFVDVTNLFSIHVHKSHDLANRKTDNRDKLLSGEIVESACIELYKNGKTYESFSFKSYADADSFVSQLIHAMNSQEDTKIKEITIEHREGSKKIYQKNTEAILS